MAAPATAGERVVFAAAGDFGFIDLDEAGEHAAVGRHARMRRSFAAINQADLYGPKQGWRCSCSAEMPLGMGRHQIGRPGPRGQRQLGVVHDRAGGHRGLLAAAGAFQSCLGLQLQALFLPQAGQTKPCGQRAATR